MAIGVDESVLAHGGPRMGGRRGPNECGNKESDGSSDFRVAGPGGPCQSDPADPTARPGLAPQASGLESKQRARPE